jgi:hypothetical protein
LTRLAGSDTEGLGTAIDDGTRVLDAIDTHIARLRADLGGVPSIGAPDEAIRLSADTRARYDGLVRALAETQHLARDWRMFTRGALDANRLTTLLADHDRSAGDAAKAGSRQRYRDALDALETAERQLAEAATLRDTVARNADVTTLDRWIERNRAYDKALRTLYQSLVDSGGRVTQGVRDAFAAEQQARARLPGDTRALVVIMGDLARGGLNQAVIAIEEVRGKLATALATLDASPSLSGA